MQELIVRRPKLHRLRYVKDRRTIVKERLTAKELLVGYVQWLKYLLQRRHG